MLNPVVETPAQLQAPDIDVPLSEAIINYTALPEAAYVSNIEGTLEQRLAQVKSKDAKGPQHTARANALAADARQKRIQQSEDLAARRRNAAIDPISNLDKKQQERRAKVKSKDGVKGPQREERMRAMSTANRKKRLIEMEASAEKRKASPDAPPSKKAKPAPVSKHVGAMRVRASMPS